MALLTEGKVNQFGVKEEYWRILGININLQYEYCDITLGGYSSLDARQEGSEPMNIKKVRAKWDKDEFFKFFAPKSFSTENTLSKNIYNRSYEYVKQKDEYFSDAEDC